MNLFTTYWGLLLSVVVVVVLIYIISVYNNLVRLKNNIDRAWANIDVLLKQRFDELPNLVATVKGFAKHEKGLMESTTRLRTQFANAQNIHDKAVASQGLTQAFASIFAVAENYPKLTSSDNFLALQHRISDLESAIADRREFYNDSTSTYNIRIEEFPDTVFARMFGYTRKELFSAPEAEKQPIVLAKAAKKKK